MTRTSRADPLRRATLLAALASALAGCKTRQEVRPSSKVVSVTEVSTRLDEQKKACQALEKLELSSEEERKLGEAWVAEHALRTLEDPVLGPWLQELGMKVAASSARPELSWRFAITQEPEVRTAHAPGGFVFVSLGLLRTTSTETQVAGVLAHEVAHVAARHMLVQQARVRTDACLGRLMHELMLSTLHASRPAGSEGPLADPALDAKWNSLALTSSAASEKMRVEMLNSTYRSMFEDDAVHESLRLLERSGHPGADFLAWLSSEEGQSWDHRAVHLSMFRRMAREHPRAQPLPPQVKKRLGK